MKRNLIDKYEVENTEGQGIISVRQKSGYKTLFINDIVNVSHTRSNLTYYKHYI